MGTCTTAQLFREFATSASLGYSFEVRAHKYNFHQLVHRLSFLLHPSSRLVVLLLLAMLIEEPWTKTPEEILQNFSVDPSKGLTSDLAAKQAELYGKNGSYLQRSKRFNKALCH